MIVIIGGGLTGLSTSYHLGHQNCLVLEKNDRPYGLIGSETRNGFTWDQGPHVSFTKHDYVKDVFAASVDGDYDEYQAKVGNHYKGCWIDHPAQTSLYQIPEPLRSQCLASFLESRATNQTAVAQNYQDWQEQAFGKVFAQEFPGPYTRKYWTVEPRKMSVDWLGGRVLRPDVQDVVDGSRASLGRNMHYINTVRYPRRGGYQSFAGKFADGCNLRLETEVIRIDLQEKTLWLSNGESLSYSTLVNTMPLPHFLSLCKGVPGNVLAAADALSCSGMVLVDVWAPEIGTRPENWLYVYDEERLSTRLHFVEKLTPGNAPAGWTGIQTEVYFSCHKPLPASLDRIGRIVFDELIDMGILSPDARHALTTGQAGIHTRKVAWANVIFHHQTRSALEDIWGWLETMGLRRTKDDTSPLTDWRQDGKQFAELGATLVMGGRFGQWKYYWSDDCTLRGREIAGQLRHRAPPA
jgi:protoporphyrinogen oxidase